MVRALCWEGPESRSQPVWESGKNMKEENAKYSRHPLPTHGCFSFLYIWFWPRKRKGGLPSASTSPSVDVHEQVLQVHSHPMLSSSFLIEPNGNQASESRGPRASANVQLWQLPGGEDTFRIWSLWAFLSGNSLALRNACSTFSHTPSKEKKQNKEIFEERIFENEHNSCPWVTTWFDARNVHLKTVNPER